MRQIPNDERQSRSEKRLGTKLSLLKDRSQAVEKRGNCRLYLIARCRAVLADLYSLFGANQPRVECVTLMASGKASHADARQSLALPAT